MSLDLEPERTRPIDGAALRQAWRRRLRRRIDAAGVAFAPAPLSFDPARAFDAPAATGGWVANPAGWPGGADQAASARVAEAAAAFAADAELAPMDAATAHPLTGMALPVMLDDAGRAALVAGRPDPSLAAFGLFLPPDWRARRSRWTNAVLRGLLTPGHLAALRTYVRALRAAGLMTLGDSQVPKRYRLYDEPVMHGLHRLLTPLIERVVGAPLLASYAYLATYVDGADLPAHVDREQCRWNMSLALDQTPGLALEDAWPLYVQPQDRAVPIRLLPGDAVIYSGTDLPHGRLPLPVGQTATLCFFHFVEPGFEGALR